LIYKYSVVKHQAFDLTTAENKTFFFKKAQFSTVTKDSLFSESDLDAEPSNYRCQFFEISDINLEISKKTGGDDRSRTCDPLNANQVLSQLSYIPTVDLRFEIQGRKTN
jgi:hypothetical protein